MMVPSRSNMATLVLAVGARFNPHKHVFLGPRVFNHWKRDSPDTAGLEPDASDLVKNGWAVEGREPTQHEIFTNMW